MIKAKLVEMFQGKPPAELCECTFPTMPPIPGAARIGGKDYEIKGYRWDIEPGGEAVLFLGIIDPSPPTIVRAGADTLDRLPIIGPKQ